MSDGSKSRSSISYDADRRPQRIVGTNIDVTERRQTESIVKESQARLAAALAAGQVMAFEWDAETRLSHRSDNAAAILGEVDSGGDLHKDFFGRVHPDDRTLFRQCLRQLRPDNASYALSFRFTRRNGQQIWLEETGRGEFELVWTIATRQGPHTRCQRTQKSRDGFGGAHPAA